MDLPDWFLVSVFAGLPADDLVRWRAVSTQWRDVITSPELFRERRRLLRPVEPLLVFHLDLLLESYAGALARYFPSQDVDAAPPQAEQPVAMLAAAPPQAEQPVANVAASPPQAEQPVAIVAADPPQAEQPVAIVAADPPQAEQPVGILAADPPQAEQPVAIVAADPPQAEQPVGILAAAPPQAEQPVAIVAAVGILAAELDQELTSTILLLCRASDLVEWRRVCKLWRTIISSNIFMVAHRDLHRHEPAAMLMLTPNPARWVAAAFRGRPLPAPRTRDALYLETLQNIGTDPRSEPLLLVDGDHRMLNVHACLDSVLLMSYNGHLIAVNPVTRRGILLPPIHTGASILALFRGAHHQDFQPDYRILYCNTERPVGAYGSFSIATRQSMSLGCPATSRAVEYILRERMPNELGPPLVVDQTIHWLAGTMILCFDTILSQFGLLAPPPTDVHSPPNQLLEIQGVLAVATFGYPEPILEVWVQRPEWHRLHHIRLPVNEVTGIQPFDFYDYYVVSADGQVLVDMDGYVLHFGSNGVLLGRYERRDYHVTAVPFMLKKSLLPL